MNTSNESLKITPDQLIEFMQRHRISDVYLADVLGVTKPAVDHWLKGRRDFPPTAVKLLRYFDQHPSAMEEFRILLQGHYL